MPSVSFWSFLQSPPFVVISWAEKPQDHLDLFIEPRRGLTRELLYHAKGGQAIHTPGAVQRTTREECRHGRCENILMVASGFGIAAQLPYLKRLIHSYNSRRCTPVESIWLGRFRISVGLRTASCFGVKKTDRTRSHNCGVNAAQCCIR
jgi:hypothetical protein